MAPIRVLHVDDEQGFCDLVRDLLVAEDDRFDVVTETRARDALDRLDVERFDCVVSDYQMPGMDGLEFFEAVRESHPDLPFVLFTGKGSEEIAAEAVSAGVTDYLQKSAGTDTYTILANRVGNAAERYRAQQEAMAARERLETLLADSADYIHILDAEGTVQYTTPSVERVLGFDPETLAGRDVLGRIHPEDRDLARERLEAVVSDPESETLTEVRAQHRNGDWRWLEVKARNLLDDPTIEGIVANVRDVTERKERAAEVDWHKQIIQGMDEGVYVLDPDHEFRFVDYRADTVDLSVQDWQGRDVSYLAETDVFTPDQVDAIRTAVDDLFADDAGEIRLELEPAVPESTEALELRLTPLDSEIGSFVLGTTRDITAHRRRERELRETKERYRTLIETFPDGGVFAFDEDLTYTLAGGRGLSDVGLTSADMEGKTPFDVFPESIAEELARNYRATLDGEATVFEQAFEGSHYRVRTVPLHDDAGNVTAGMAVSQDVTAQYERERELERQNERLEEFASVVSHDLRNPLTVLRTSLDLAADTGDDDHFERCQRNVDRMETLIDDLLTLARQGEAIDSTSSVDLSRLATDCWESVDTAGADLSVEGDVVVRADPTRLRQFFENLFNNAVRHGGPDVTVTVGVLDPMHTDTRVDCDGLRGFYVADDGTGVPEADRDDVFDSGYSTTQAGTGFGLAIVAEIAEAHGWDIALTESEDGGARFEVTGVDVRD
jgi:PAS domain S-box-containing protein